MNDIIYERVLKNSIKNPITGCLEWQKSKNVKGYGTINYTRAKNDNGAILVHRVVWMKMNGEIPKNKLIMHVCDNPSCVEITHLLLGTAAQNTKDMMEKNRHRKPYSKQSHILLRSTAKLTVEQVKEIKRLLLLKVTAREIAKQTNASINSIYSIKGNKTWAHIDSHIIFPVNTRSKINIDQVINIKKKINMGKKEKEICRETNISRSIVNKIRLGLRWKHVII